MRFSLVQHPFWPMKQQKMKHSHFNTHLLALAILLFFIMSQVKWNDSTFTLLPVGVIMSCETVYYLWGKPTLGFLISQLWKKNVWTVCEQSSSFYSGDGTHCTVVFRQMRVKWDIKALKDKPHFRRKHLRLLSLSGRVFCLCDCRKCW